MCYDCHCENWEKVCKERVFFKPTFERELKILKVQYPEELNKVDPQNKVECKSNGTCQCNDYFKLDWCDNSFICIHKNLKKNGTF